MLIALRRVWGRTNRQLNQMQIAVREFAPQLGGVAAVAAPGIIISRRDCDSLHPHAKPLPHRARDECVYLALPIECATWIEKTAVLIARESYKLEFPALRIRRQTQSGNKIIGRVFRILRAHRGDFDLSAHVNPADIVMDVSAPA